MDFLRVGLPQALASLGVERFQLGLNSTCVLLGLWCLLSTAEWIGQFELFDERGLLSWRVLSLRAHWVYQNPWLQWIYRRSGVALLLAVRLVCGAAVMLPAEGWFRVCVLAAIVLTGWLFKLRNWLSNDGADQMGQIVAIGATLMAIGTLVPDLLLSLAGVLLIAGQLAIAYFLAGAAKLVSYEWRSGRALVGIMGTQSFGHDFGARMASSSVWFSIAFCWLVILMEIVFPVVLLAPKPVLLSFLAAFALFHLATALFMGLNTYIWAFLATYPAAWLFSDVVATVHRG